VVEEVVDSVLGSRYFLDLAGLIAAALSLSYYFIEGFEVDSVRHAKD
jgi:hypothetical protein